MPESRYGVKVSRGPRLQLEPHPNACDLEDIHTYAALTDRPLAIDLFCCGGGLSLGIEEAGFQVILGVDQDELAIETHRAHFGGVSLGADLSDPSELSRISDALKGIDIALVAGSPPCQPFSRAGINKIRSLVANGSRSLLDHRKQLWKSFATFVDNLRPEAFILENVPDLIVGSNGTIVREIVSVFEEMGYKVHTRVLPSWQFGVPQFRQRLFVVGTLGHVYRWPRPNNKRNPTVRDAISDLPAVEAGKRDLEVRYYGPTTSYQRAARRGLRRGPNQKVYDHMARAVRPDDLEAFRLMDSDTLYSELPQRLRRYRADIFDDKYKRLSWSEPSRTITAHIARDGYWYIHPSQHRTLTVREAARIQSFPDRIRFAGTPSHAFRQIGEAVPPLLGKAVGKAVERSLHATHRVVTEAASTSDISSALIKWLEKTPESQLAAPWRQSRNAWSVLVGNVLFEKAARPLVDELWPKLCERWPDHKTFLDNPRRGPLAKGFTAGKGLQTLRIIAQALAQASGSNPCIEKLPISRTQRKRMEVAATIAGQAEILHPTAVTCRVAQRVLGELPKGAHFGDQLLLSRLVGFKEPGRAYAAVLEIGDKFCRPGEPSCNSCPLVGLCLHSRQNSRRISRKKLAEAPR